MVVPSKTPLEFGGVKYCEFETITVVPMQPNLVIPSLMNDEERHWLNQYNARCREVVRQTATSTPLPPPARSVASIPAADSV